MKTTKLIKAGEQIFDDNGEIPRADLLRRYGYISDSYAPYDVVELPLETVCQAAGLENANIEIHPQVYTLDVPLLSYPPCYLSTMLTASPAAVS